MPGIGVGVGAGSRAVAAAAAPSWPPASPLTGFTTANLAFAAYSRLDTLFAIYDQATAAADAGPVGRWEDLSGNGRHLIATGTTRPTLIADGSGQGTRPAVRFAGGDDWLLWVSAFVSVPFTAMVLGRSSQTSPAELMVNGDCILSAYTGSGTGWGSYVGATGAWQASGTTVATPKIVTYTRSSTSAFSFATNAGSPDARTGAGTPLSLAQHGVGNDQYAQSLIGDVYAVFVWSAALNDTDRLTNVARLNALYGVY
jgi:hypothetical protein